MNIYPVAIVLAFARRRARIVLALGLAWLFTGLLPAAETIPPAPSKFFNDYTGTVSDATARTLDTRLADHERATSSQIVVAIFPRMASDSSVEDYTVRVAQAWGAGRKERDNGAVLFAFMQERQLYLQVGYGLEGAIPDALAKRIIEDEIVPRMRAGKPDAAFTAAVDAMLAATRGEYTGTGRTLGERNPKAGQKNNYVFLIFIILAFLIARYGKNSTEYRSSGRRHTWISTGGGGGGGSRSGGGGSFSGGGGGFGGGGAGGKW